MSAPPVPPDDLSRDLTVARPDEDQSLPHIGLVGDTYTILVTGRATPPASTRSSTCMCRRAAGRRRTATTSRRCSPSSTAKSQVTFRGETVVARAGETINVPANAPHAFTNAGSTPGAVAVPVRARRARRSSSPWSASPSPPGPRRRRRWTRDAQAAFIAKSQSLAPDYKTELLPPPGCRVTRRAHS